MLTIQKRTPLIDSLAGNAYWYQREGEKWVRKPNAIRDCPGFKNICIQLLENIVSEISHSSDFFGTDMYKASGTPTPSRPDFYQPFPNIRHNNKPFSVKQRNGQIVVSNYQIGSIYWKFENGGPTEKFGSPSSISCNVSAINTKHGMFTLEDIDNRLCLRISENHAVYGNVNYKRQIVKTSDGVLCTFEPPNTDWLVSQFEYDTDLVTSVLAQANTKSIDILTAAAEMPETARSALSGCLTIVKLFKEAKRGEFRLGNKAKKVKREYDYSLSLLTKAQRNEVLTKREMERRKKQLRNTYKLQVKEISDALADVWLNFRYNITPNVILIESALKVSDSLSNRYFEFTETSMGSLNVLDGFTGSIDVLDKAFIKRKFDVASPWHHLSANPFLTAWELIPLSFVIDWVVNIGNVLATLSSPRTSFEEGATYSWKVKGRLRRTFEDGTSVIGEIRGYKRNVITPQSLCGLSFNPDINQARQLDALALSWKIALKKLF